MTTAAEEDASAGNAVPRSHTDPQGTNGTRDQPLGSDGAVAEKQGDNVHRKLSRRSTVRSKLKSQKDKLISKTAPPGGFDSTPIPDAPPGYTVKFTFHGATNLPIADIGTGAADPFLTATLSTSLPKRHKEDPDLFYRTRTIRRTLEPEWEEEWIVANVPPSGFRLKCRMYDEDSPDKDDRIGNVTIFIHQVNEQWEGIALDREFKVKKRMGSKRAYVLKACMTPFSEDHSFSPRLRLSAQVIGRSDPPYAQIHTVGPTHYFKHFSPMIGRMTGVRVNRDENADSQDHEAQPAPQGRRARRKAQRYDFQASEIQLSGPVPPKLYHRFVEFRPIIGLLFRNRGIRGHILNRALHHQHRRVYNFDKSTEYGTFPPCSEEASLQFLRMAHFDQGGRIFTYVITLDGMMRFTETGKEFGIDLLSKHTMHSDGAVYIACSGEFIIRRLEKPTSLANSPEPDQPTHPPRDDVPGGPPLEPEPSDQSSSSPPTKPEYYQLVIDNDSGTYRPDKSVLPHLREFLERNFPGLGIVVLACDDPKDQELKKQQRSAKASEGEGIIRMVRNRSPSGSSISSDDLSDLDELEETTGDRGDDGGGRWKSKREKALEMIEEPRRLRELKALATGSGSGGNEETGMAGPSRAQTTHM